MRAVVVAQVPGTPEVTNMDTPRPEVGELLVRVAASSVNGFDVSTVAGRVQGMMEHRFPLIVGMDFAGAVEAVGGGVDGFAVGDAVFGVVLKPYVGAGSMAQFVTVPAAMGVARLPEGVPVRQAGALGVAGSAALDGLAALGPIEGKTVLISGATGGVGALAVQLAAAGGARVVATATPGPRAEFVSALTDAEVLLVDYTHDLAAQVRALAPEGLDAVLHLAGDPAELTALVRDGGAVVSLVSDVEAPEGRKLPMLHANPSADTLSALAGHVAAGELSVPVTAVYDLEQAPEAFTAFGASTVGKIALTVA